MSTFERIWILQTYLQFYEENCALPGYYAASIGNLLRRFKTDSFSRNFGKNLVRNSPEEHSSHLLRSGSLKLLRSIILATIIFYLFVITCHRFV